jgi:hypothetical protein
MHRCPPIFIGSEFLSLTAEVDQMRQSQNLSKSPRVTVLQPLKAPYYSLPKNAPYTMAHRLFTKFPFASIFFQHNSMCGSNPFSNSVMVQHIKGSISVHIGAPDIYH